MDANGATERAETLAIGMGFVYTMTIRLAQNQFCPTELFDRAVSPLNSGPSLLGRVGRILCADGIREVTPLALLVIGIGAYCIVKSWRRQPTGAMTN